MTSRLQLSELVVCKRQRTTQRIELASPELEQCAWEYNASGKATATGGWWDYGAESRLYIYAHGEVMFAWACRLRQLYQLLYLTQ